MNKMTINFEIWQEVIDEYPNVAEIVEHENCIQFPGAKFIFGDRCEDDDIIILNLYFEISSPFSKLDNPAKMIKLYQDIGKPFPKDAVLWIMVLGSKDNEDDWHIDEYQVIDRKEIEDS